MQVVDEFDYVEVAELLKLCQSYTEVTGSSEALVSIVYRDACFPNKLVGFFDRFSGQHSVDIFQA